MLFPFQSAIKSIKFERTNSINFQYDFNRYPRVALYGDDYYCLYEGLYSMKMSNREWVPLKGVESFSVEGCSMISTSEGLVLYGGKLNDFYSNEMWIFTDSWHPIAGNQSPCAHHAACFIPNSSALLVHGGIDQNGIRSDCYLIDLISGSSTKIELKQKLAFSHHTITLMNDNIVYLFGGVDKDKHLNPNLYSINIKTGDVQLISISTNTLQRAMRCCHHAFNFFGFFCIAGGFQFGIPLYNLALYDSTHDAWLEISFDDFLSQAWFVSFEEKMLRIFGKKLKEVRELYFTQNLEPFVDDNDPQLFNFISRLLNYNIANDLFNMKEVDLIMLLDNIEKLRGEVADKYSTKQQNNNFGKPISDLTSEKEQLERAIISLNDDYEKQKLKIEKRKMEQNQAQSNNQVASSASQSTSLMSLIKQIDTEKGQMKSYIEQAQEKIKQNMANIEKICPSYAHPSRCSQLSFNKEDLEFIQKETDLKQIKKENEEVDKQLKNLENRIKGMKRQKHSINKSIAEGLGYLQDISNRICQVRSETAQKKKEYYKLQTMLIEHQYIENAIQLSDNTQTQNIKSLLTQITSFESEKKRYAEKMPKLLHEFDEHLKNIMNSPVQTNEIDIALELITEIKNFQADAQTRFADISSSNNETLKSNQYQNSKKIINLRNEKWENYYNNVLEMVSIIDETEAKSVQ